MKTELTAFDGLDFIGIENGRTMLAAITIPQQQEVKLDYIPYANSRL